MQRRRPPSVRRDRHRCRVLAARCLSPRLRARQTIPPQAQMTAGAGHPPPQFPKPPPTPGSHPPRAPAAGPANLALPAATFDVAQASLADLRLIDASGQEVPYLLDRDLSVRGYERAHAFAPKSFRSIPAGDTTQLLLESGTGSRL